MIYKWQLKSSEDDYHIIQKGTVEAASPVKAIIKLNKEMNVHPHAGEVLEIIEPDKVHTNIETSDIILT